MADENGAKDNFATTVLKYAAVMGALLYFSGWLYLYHYYRHFEIEVSMLQLSTQEIVLHSAQVIQYLTRKLFCSWWSMGVCGIGVAIWAGIRWGGPIWACLPTIHVFIKYYVLTLIALAIPGVLISIARSAALDQARLTRIADREGANFSFKPECAKGDLNALNELGKLRMLAATEKFYFVYAQTGERKGGRISSIDLFHVSRDCVLSVEFLVRHPK